jgi:hypothetical protein
VNLVHQKRGAYRAKRMRLTYCRIGVFQGFAAHPRDAGFWRKNP